MEQETITVRVRDRAAESQWGSGPTSPVIRDIETSAFCPAAGCGRRRGTPRSLRQHDDGVWYSTDTWQNPCGHVDMYEAVLIEAAVRRHGARAAA